jgi:ribonucleoside-diphosphate reductase alpha chain
MTASEWLNNNELSYTIWNNKYRYDHESFDEWLDRVSNGDLRIRKFILDKKFLFGGRTLANRNIPGAGSYSNCYSIGYVPDSLEGIMDVATKIALTFKSQGGEGLSLSKIRPKGSKINGMYESDGIVPFMNIFNTVTESISQGGSRKGALMMSIDAWHKEAPTFIKIKEDSDKINKANLSIEIDNDFMSYLDRNEPVKIVNKYSGNRVSYEVNPQEIFNMIAESAWKSAEPGVLFVDKLRNYNLMEFVDSYQIETTNPCGN